MPYELVADKISKISPENQGELLQFIDFLLFRQGDNSVFAITKMPGPTATQKRHPGGIPGEFHMADDFDAPLEEFAEYM